MKINEKKDEFKMAIIASGQISIVDLNDSKQLQLFIGSNQPKTQIYNPNNGTYAPNWTTSKPVLTPQLYIAGNSNDIIAQATSIVWYEGETVIASTNTNYTIPTTGVKTLTINNNILSNKNSQLFICEVTYTDPSTGFPVIAKADFEFVKVTSGSNGANAISGFLTNDSTVIPLDANGNNGVYANASTEFKIYNGATDDSANWTVTAVASAGITGTLTGRTYAVTAVTSNFTTGTVTLTATKSGTTIVKMFAVSATKTGVAGTTPTAYWLVTDVGAISKSPTGQYTPSTLNVTAKAQTGTGAPANYSGRFIISETVNGTDWVVKYTSTANEATKAHPISTAGLKAIRVQMYVAGATTNLLDEQIIPVVSDGTLGVNAISGFLTNDSTVVPLDANGNNGVYTNASTELKVYDGNTDDSANWTVTATPSTGITGALTGRVYRITALATSFTSGTVTLTATKSGQANIVKVFAVSATKTGATGASPTAYWLVSETGAIQKSEAGVYSPSTVSFTAKSQTGSGAPANYLGRWIISTTTNGTDWTDVATSTANEATKSYLISGNIKAVRARLYVAGATTNLLDEQIIPVVYDGISGSDGQNAVTAVVWTPDGNMIKNSEGSLTAKVDVYNGSTLVTPSAFKWYIQDETATTASGGDADGGNGWRLLTTTANFGITGIATSTITIPASAIVNVESFKAVVTYSGKKFSDVCSVVDITDPIVCTIVGVSTFKNGTGSSVMTAKLYQNGDEIDVDGDDYTYTWSLYNASNVLDTTFSKTGKSITVNASEISSRASLVCSISN